MTDVSAILGIALIGVGAASAVYGAILCYTVKVTLSQNTAKILLSYVNTHVAVLPSKAQLLTVFISSIKVETRDIKDVQIA